MWMLVVILIANQQPNAIYVDSYPTMIECFKNREIVWESFPNDKSGFQAVCVRYKGYIE